MVELTGSLSGIGLLAVVQLIGEVHHSGNLELRKADATGTLAFDDGRLVAAECGEHYGLQALADCLTDLAEGDFTFVEGIRSLERTLDVGPSDLKRLLDRVSSGEFDLLANGEGSPEESQIRAETTCPLLGFADDNAHHYSRPTALHRCYSGGGQSLVSAPEQRDLCLSGRFGACPRFRNTERSQAAAMVVREPPPASPPPSPTLIRQPEAPSTAPGHAPAAAAAPDVPATDVPARGTPPAAHTAPGIPAAVAVRLAAGQQMHMSSEPPPTPARESDTDVDAAPGRPTRGVMVILGGAVLGFLLVGLIMLVVLPALRPAPSPPSAGFEVVTPATPAIAGVVATPPAIATAANVSPPGAAANGSPTLVGNASSAATISSRTRSATPAPPLASRASASTVQATPLAAGRMLMDVRFAAGPAGNWVHNPPYAAWSDGAYRFQAHDTTHFVAVGVPINEVMSDVIIQATFRKTGGPPGGGYGLIVRDQGPAPRDGKNQEMTAYVLETGDQGDYGVWRRDGDHWVDLVPWMHSTSVRSGGSPNDLAVRATGDQLIFSVNGADLTTVQDDALAAGGVGLFVGGDNNEVALDHFSVQVPN